MAGRRAGPWAGAGFAGGPGDGASCGAPGLICSVVTDGLYDFDGSGDQDYLAADAVMDKFVLPAAFRHQERSREERGVA